ncbi:MAG: shikimate dehydrogenase, partial [Desulfobacca sp.]|uniref:shikimate dehydrogenase n=1 Tax=Desulfobacca sp. TaxID=2067990 RepID=UPI00404AB13F
MISGTTTIYGILGQPVAHSLSPAMHNAAFAAQGLDAVYVAFPVADLAQAVAGLRGLGIAGVSVTIPFKEAIIPLLDEVDDNARTIGAVNTVVKREGRLWGTNTDWLGALAALQDQVDLAGQQVLVLGAGGAGRAIVYAVRQAGAQVWVADAQLDRAQTLAREFGVTAVPWGEVVQVAAAILINATPVGMAPHAADSPYPAAPLANLQVVMDIVYKPLQTRLLREAAMRGCRTIDGLE